MPGQANPLHLFHFRCSELLTHSVAVVWHVALNFYFYEKKSHWERAKSSEARANSEGTEEERKRGEAFPPVVRICA